MDAPSYVPTCVLERLRKIEHSVETEIADLLLRLDMMHAKGVPLISETRPLKDEIVESKSSLDVAHRLIHYEGMKNAYKILHGELFEDEDRIGEFVHLAVYS